ncbi:integrase family protein [Stanieria cyanosphaera PCC 7437]|uniref:Integrase family protein n=1 Tax=Stanieria cyanosphaera (strain ATCC 29371 / PCC 7437) TaxID=111780 RepID=K9XV72_STAC7|nr:site-specific integrase [Stanieria cyanosphaera]AFZ35964.1 integrase family protein [Stanieria cyanosphaera PCC 7437]
MYTKGQEYAKVGRVTVDVKGKSYRIRLTYPEGTRHEFSIARVSPEGWTTAIKAAQLISRDCDLGDFDDTYARYSPKHAKKLEIASQVKEYDLLELWEIYKENSKNSVAKTTQKSAWKHFDSMVRSVAPEHLKLSKANDFIQALLKRYSPGTLTVFTKTLYPCINQAVSKGLIPRNPYKDISLPRTQKPTIEAFEPKEIKAIIAAFYSDEFVAKGSSYKHSHYATYVELLALTGCRPEEAIALTWDDIKEREGKMFIRFNRAYSKGILLLHTKTHEIRLFPCNEQLQRVIRDIPRSHENKLDLLFPSQEWKYIDQGNFRQRYWKKVVDGLVAQGKVEKYLKPYCLRYSFITRMIREGVDIATVAALVGNSTEMIVKHYLASRKDFDLPEL